MRQEYNHFAGKIVLLQMVQAFSNGPCTVEAKKSGKFNLYGGMVQGHFEALV